MGSPLPLMWPVVVRGRLRLPPVTNFVYKTKLQTEFKNNHGQKMGRDVAYYTNTLITKAHAEILINTRWFAEKSLPDQGRKGLWTARKRNRPRFDDIPSPRQPFEVNRVC